jgi:hypothetical protein
MKRSFYYSWAQLTRVPPLHSLCSVVLLCLQSWTRKQALTDEASILWDMHELCLLSCTLSAFPQVCFHILWTRTFELRDWDCFCTKHWAKWQARQDYNLMVSIFYGICIFTSCAYCNAHCPHFLKSAFIYTTKNLLIGGLLLWVKPTDSSLTEGNQIGVVFMCTTFDTSYIFIKKWNIANVFLISITLR